MLIEKKKIKGVLETPNRYKILQWQCLSFRLRPPTYYTAYCAPPILSTDTVQGEGPAKGTVRGKE